jgi:hypothetical protein
MREALRFETRIVPQSEVAALLRSPWEMGILSTQSLVKALF